MSELTEQDRKIEAAARSVLRPFFTGIDAVRDAVEVMLAASGDVLGQVHDALARAEAAEAERDRLARIVQQVEVLADVDDLARVLMQAWETAEGKPVGVSYVATFADMARAVDGLLRAVLNEEEE